VPEGRNVAVATMRKFIFDLNQNEFAMVMEEAGIAKKANDLMKTYAALVLSAKAMVEKLSAADRTKLAIKLGTNIAEDLPASESTVNAAAFLSRLFLQTKSTMLGEI